MLNLSFVGAFMADAQQVSKSHEGHSNAMIGVLEDHPGVYFGDPNYWRVRAIFEKKGSDWRAFPHTCREFTCLKTLTVRYPKEVAWTIAFEERNLGQVTARTPSDFQWYADVGCQEITSSRPVPTIGKTSKEYSGFLSSPVYRPLVAVSDSQFRDPAMWKPAPLSTEIVGALRQQFLRKFPRPLNCKNPDENILKARPCLHKDIRIGKAYSSKENWSLAELRLEGDSPFIGHWYVIGPTGEIRFLGSEMWLVDAGDYDGDGESEVLFAIVGYNLGGYRLFYRNFSKSAEFEFNYH
jgi:hypothetical protein